MIHVPAVIFLHYQNLILPAQGNLCGIITLYFVVSEMRLRNFYYVNNHISHINLNGFTAERI